VKLLFTLIVAVAGGFIGGSLSNRMGSVRAAAPDVIRASRFELIDESGRRIGVWERNSKGQSLTFVGKDGNQQIAFGLLNSSYPFLDMTGRDGKLRLTLRLGRDDKPLLGMSDEKWEGRLLLGFIEHDVSSSRDDDWGLLFRAPGLFQNLASIGITSNPAGVKSGMLSVRSSTGKTWSVPQ
jgi:hypothetical protein